jgi:hypothetical protein
MFIAVLAHNRRLTRWAVDYATVVDQAALSCDETYGLASDVSLSDPKQPNPAWLDKR